MKKIFTLILSLMMAMTLSEAVAQHKHSDKEKAEMRREMEEYKVKFLSQEMELSGDTQKKFAELYTERGQALGAIYRAKHQAEKKLKAMASPADSDYEEYRKVQNETKQKEAEIIKDYDAKFNNLLTSKQLFKMQEAEGKFRDKMKELRDARKGKSHGKSATAVKKTETGK